MTSRGRALRVLLVAASWAGACRAEPLRVLTYGSMIGRGSLGEFMARAWARQCPGCELKFVTTGETAGLWGRLRADQRRRGRAGYDVVLGLPAHHYRAALAAGLVSAGQAFDRSPFAIIVDTRKLAAKDWPRHWSELPVKIKQGLLVQDPRTSASGLGWLRAVFEFKLLDLPAARRTAGKVFPSWSAAFEAFTKGAAPAVWSYQTSEAYLKCAGHGEDHDRYRVLPLAEGYPVQEEWVAAAGRRPSDAARRFVAFALSPEVQQSVATLNWMLPARAGVRLPECFDRVTPVRALEGAGDFSLAALQEWTDQWSL